MRSFAPITIIGLLLLGLNLLYTGQSTNLNNKLLVSFLDVGQGDSILIESPSKNYYLIDGGPDKKVLEELGRELPPTKKELTGVFLTHPHQDHLSGLNYVLESFNVKNVYLTGAIHTTPDYLEFLDLISESKISTHKFLDKSKITDDELSIQSLWPPEDIQYKDLNQTSMVILITYKNNKVILMGDLPEEEQEKMVEKVPENTDIIKISHHGSKYGLSNSLLKRLNPKYAVISVGKNSFGHPAPSTITRLQGNILLRTDQNGTVRFVLDGNSTSLY